MSEEEKCREAFEAFVGQRMPWLSLASGRGSLRMYHYIQTCSHWETFRAAWNLRQQVPDGMVLVPKEPTPEMLNAIWVGGSRAESYASVLAAAPKPEDVK